MRDGKEKGKTELTRDVDRFPERTSNRSVQLDDELLVICNLLVAILDNLMHPLLERLTHQCVGHIHDELTRQSRDVTIIRQMVGNLRMFFAELKNRLDTQTFIMWHVEHLDVLRVNVYRRDQMHLMTYTSSFP